MMSESEIIKNAPQLSSNNRAEVEKNKECGCYFCMRIINTKRIKEYTNDGSAICPVCGVDSLLPGITLAHILSKAADQWFANSLLE